MKIDRPTFLSWIDGYYADELTPAQWEAFERYLEEHPEDRREAERHRALLGAMAALERPKAPDALRERVRAALAAQNQKEESDGMAAAALAACAPAAAPMAACAAEVIPAAKTKPRRTTIPRWLQAAALVLVALTGWRLYWIASRDAAPAHGNAAKSDSESAAWGYKVNPAKSGTASSSARVAPAASSAAQPAPDSRAGAEPDSNEARVMGDALRAEKTSDSPSKLRGMAAAMPAAPMPAAPQPGEAPKAQVPNSRHLSATESAAKMAQAPASSAPAALYAPAAPAVPAAPYFDDASGSKAAITLDVSSANERKRTIASAKDTLASDKDKMGKPVRSPATFSSINEENAPPDALRSIKAGQEGQLSEAPASERLGAPSPASISGAAIHGASVSAASAPAASSRADSVSGAAVLESSATFDAVSASSAPVDSLSESAAANASVDWGDLAWLPVFMKDRGAEFLVCRAEPPAPALSSSLSSSSPFGKTSHWKVRTPSDIAKVHEALKAEFGRRGYSEQGAAIYELDDQTSDKRLPAMAILNFQRAPGQAASPSSSSSSMRKEDQEAELGNSKIKLINGDQRWLRNTGNALSPSDRNSKDVSAGERRQALDALSPSNRNSLEASVEERRDAVRGAAQFSPTLSSASSSSKRPAGRLKASEADSILSSTSNGHLATWKLSSSAKKASAPRADSPGIIQIQLWSQEAQLPAGLEKTIQPNR